MTIQKYIENEEDISKDMVEIEKDANDFVLKRRKMIVNPSGSIYNFERIISIEEVTFSDEELKALTEQHLYEL